MYSYKIYSLCHSAKVYLGVRHNVTAHNAVAVNGEDLHQFGLVAASDHGYHISCRIREHNQFGAYVGSLLDRQSVVCCADGAQGVGFAISPAVAYAVVGAQRTGLVVVADRGEKNLTYLVYCQIRIGLQHQCYNACHCR